jgi:hypothetical protein
MPVSGHLVTHTWDDLDMLCNFYNLEEYPVEWYQRFCGLLLKNRMNPGFAGVNYVDHIASHRCTRQIIWHMIRLFVADGN